MFVLHKGDGGRPFFESSGRTAGGSSGKTAAYGETEKHTREVCGGGAIARR